MGWGWDSMMGNSSYARENKVIGNHFHDTMQLLFDGGDLCKRHNPHLFHPVDSVGSVGSDSHCSDVHCPRCAVSFVDCKAVSAMSLPADTLGSQPGSEAAYNHIHGHKGCTKTNGLYHDQGTAHWTDHHNVVQLGVGPHPCRGGGRDAAAWAIM